MKNKLQVDTRSCRTSAKHPQNKMNEKTPAQGRARTSGQISPNLLHLQENDQCGCFPWSSNTYPGIHERRIYEIQFTEKLAGGQLCRREDNTGYMQLESYNITVYLNNHEGYFSLLNQPNLLICIYRKSIQAFWGFSPPSLTGCQTLFFFPLCWSFKIRCLEQKSCRNPPF